MNMFPSQLTALHQLEFDYAGGDGIDFEPYSSFIPEEEVQRWFRAWTGNEEANGTGSSCLGKTELAVSQRSV